MSDDSGEKKIIIDEDWKSQVEAEKESLEKERQDKLDPEGSAAAGDAPPASFAMLISTLATEAMVALGQMPHPATGKLEPNPKVARYFIDTLAVLQEKTKGNLTAEEEKGLEDLLHQLRLTFVGSPGEGMTNDASLTETRPNDEGMTKSE